MFKDIKLFFSFRKSLNVYRMTDVLEEAEKVKLDAFDRDILEKVYNKTLERLTSEMLKGNLSDEYVKGAKFALYNFKGHFKEYRSLKYKK